MIPEHFLLSINFSVKSISARNKNDLSINTVETNVSTDAADVPIIFNYWLNIKKNNAGSVFHFTFVLSASLPSAWGMWSGVWFSGSVVHC